MSVYGASIIRASVLLMLLTACGAEQPLVPTQGDEFMGDSEGSGDAYVPWWLADYDRPDGRDFPDQDYANGDNSPNFGDTFAGDMQGGDFFYADTLQEKLLGPWMGEIPFDNNQSERQLGVIFETDNKLVYIINPWGPSRKERAGIYAVNEQNRSVELAVSAPDGSTEAVYQWSDVSVQGDRVDYADELQNEISLYRGITPPEYGFIAEIMVYATQDEEEMEHVPKFIGIPTGPYDLEPMLQFAHNFSPIPICFDRVYGVSRLRFNGGADFTAQYISGFERYGGTHCDVKENFVLVYYGNVALPAGPSSFRFNTEYENSVFDAAAVFVDDGFLVSTDPGKAKMCSASFGLGQPKCLKIEAGYHGKSYVQLDAGVEPKEFPFEIVALIKDEKAFMQFEAAFGQLYDPDSGDDDAEFSAIPEDKLFLPDL